MPHKFTPISHNWDMDLTFSFLKTFYSIFLYKA